jgi:hypothetical protein
MRTNHQDGQLPRYTRTSKPKLTKEETGVTHIRISRAQYRCYTLGMPAAARLVQCLDAARAGSRGAAMVAGALAGVSLAASVLFAVGVLYAGWLGARHGDIHPLVWPGLAAMAVANGAGVLSRLPDLAVDTPEETLR